ncbi:putative nuclear migration protein [Aspergillus clavatus NRRL 1]|uniref:Nuclear migration protein, putative n=1 Tax=Aspergillus clavatus (strain ATCC 1007 / CBS 513.65 / DSM 816 / NCTC 3887 / NRRL 1 / QM 1276 / 107) TaxID=344612 RepID=A1CSK2_ASPCL|nr:nuclear migration protein, putative [Aspergillus clavatus NRRL 1]EAW06289.1 nuclear migration protein, putative [Aspergillus clavatus NRRL 1]
MATEVDFQSPSGSQAFPTPSTTPRRIPSIHIRHDSSPIRSSSSLVSPQNFPPDGPSDMDDLVDEDALSPLDPRRFTPTLHASLVSEILSLRREVENKSKEIDMLERTLHESRDENEGLNDRLSRSTKESRSLKHQLQLLEGGSSSALSELAKERDEALENITDMRRKLDQAQKKARHREEELERAQSLWSRERDSWDGERRSLERKVHVVEGRLKMVLSEVAAAQATRTATQDAPDPVRPSTTERSDSTSLHSSSPGRRRASVTSMSSEGDAEFHNIRYSVASVAGIHGNKPSAVSLAQELAFDEEDEFDTLHDDMILDSPEALPEERPMSVLSHASLAMSLKARKILGLSIDSSTDGPASTFDRGVNSPARVSSPRLGYRDAGIQYSLPPSPTLSEHTPVEPAAEVSPQPYQGTDSSTATLTIDMKSTSCQTIGDLPSPPWTPQVAEIPIPPVTDLAATASASTQTDLASVSEAVKEEAPAPTPTRPALSAIEVPMIAIHPPRSEPPSPRGSVVLPPQTKNVSCQTTFASLVDNRSIAIQTEEIRIDQRPVKLPASLLPSAIPDLPLKVSRAQKTVDSPIQPYRPPSPKLSKGETKPPPLPAKAPSRSKPVAPMQAYPGNNDNGPLTEGSKSELRRPFRSSSLFAGFDEEGIDGESPEGVKDIFTDDELLNRPFASYRLRRGKLVSALERSSLEDHVLAELTSSCLMPSLICTSILARGAAAHQRRARSPSEPSIDSGSGQGVRRPSLRRVRSAAAMSQSEHLERPTSQSSPSSYGLESPRYPPLPFDDITAPRDRMMGRRQSSHRASVSRPFAHERQDSSATTAIQPTSVVDAIAQTMIGEWMYKYVRRRRSFGGVGESKENWEGKNADEVSASITNSGVRHKRWVWLAPYERAVMWSSKQPTSGPALLGKSGRKLIIQSVLDVKDDNPLPKGASVTTAFNRSILILTPQRALKFTATNIERHYVWLTALSFLSHSAMGIHDLAALPPVPQAEFETPPPMASLRRNPIRDSIRIAKGRPRPNLRGKRSRQPEPVPELPPAAHGLGMADGDADGAADPPTVPRFSSHSHSHSRKRSNTTTTTPRLPIMRSFSSQGAMPSIPSLHSMAVRGGSPDVYLPSQGGGYGPSYGPNSGRSSFSRRTSEASGPSSIGTGNFFDAIGTVRMEAFIDQTDSNRFRAGTRTRTRTGTGTGTGTSTSTMGSRSRHSRKASSQWGSGSQRFYGESVHDGEHDPFGGF